MASYTLKDYQILISVEKCLQKLLTCISNRMSSQEIKDILADTKDLIDAIEVCLNEQEYQNYHEFFQTFTNFCLHFTHHEFEQVNYEQLEDSLQLTLECVSHMISVRESRYIKCCCCKQTVIFSDEEKHTCPVCRSSDTDRFIVSFMERLQLPFAAREDKPKALQFAPSESIENWLKERCPHIEYHSTDLHMESATFCTDIQNMTAVSDSSYDLIICSHVLGHIPDDGAAMKEIYRILRPNGICLLGAPVFLDDHCSAYSKQKLIDRLTESGFQVHIADKDYLGEAFFHTAGLTDTSTLYILSKQKTEDLSVLENMLKDEWQTEMKQQPLVSVIMSSYNHEPFVGEAIECVLGQTYKNIEFIVSDDGSGDGTAEVIRRYEDQITKVYYHSDNLGLRIEELMSAVSGKYTAMMNSDDVWEPDKIEKQVRILEANPQYAACFTWCDHTDAELNQMDDALFYQSNRSKEEWMKTFFHEGNRLCHPSILIKTEVYRPLLLSGILSSRQVPDLAMWVQLVQHHEIYVLPDVMVKMRRYNTENRANSSAVSTVNSMRSLMEEMYLWYSTFKEMDMNYFQYTFQKEFVDPNAGSNEELMCEKFFLLKSSDTISKRLASILFFYDLHKDNKAVECCVDVYHFTRSMFWEYCGQNGFIRLFALGQSFRDKNV